MRIPPTPRLALAWMMRIGGLGLLAIPTYLYVHAYQQVSPTVAPIGTMSADQVRLVLLLVVSAIVIISTWYVARHIYGDDILRAARAIESDELAPRGR